ncbi:MAG: sensor histidine kinase [Vicingaceae bacterium]
MSENIAENRFKQVMVPSLLMGTLTNVYLTILFVYLNAIDVVISPAISTILFLAYFFLLQTKKLTPKQISLVVSCTVVLEVAIHSYYLGLVMGFYYYLFLLPIVFFLNSNWKTWMVIFFNSSIVFFSVGIWFFIHDRTPIYVVDKDVEGYVNFINVAATAGITFFIMMYFSRTINKKDEDLIIANLELETRNKEIIGQHKNLELLLKEIHHRVKNNLQIISSLISLERGNVENEEVVRILNESRRRVEAIALIHQKLYQDKQFNRVDFKSYLEEIMRSQQDLNPHIIFKVEATEVVMSLDVAVPLGLIISEMITNSVKHAFEGIEEPTLFAKLSEEEDAFTLLVEDNGVGLTKDFSLEYPESLGLEIITALTDQIDGTIECFNNTASGASFKLTFKDHFRELK